jgi:uncharacterized protein YjbI with pentapeptide repeats
VLRGLLGKRVCFNGKFGWGVKERLAAMAEAQQGEVVDDVDAKTDYLVLPDPLSGKTIVKKVGSLNARGASIQVMDAAAFEAMVKPTTEEVVAIIRGGAAGGGAKILEKAIGSAQYYFYAAGRGAAAVHVVGENFDGLDLSGFGFSEVAFDRCSFVGATLAGASFREAAGCDFSKAKASQASFGDAVKSKFVEADLAKAQFHGDVAEADFSAATLDGAEFSRYVYGTSGSKQLATPACVFARASLRGARFNDMSLKSADFDGADLTNASARGAFEACGFRNAKLADASMFQCRLTGANFAGADLHGANFADADLSGSKFDGADLAGCNLRGAKLGGADLSKAKNYDPAATPVGGVGPALKELDGIVKQARRVQFSFWIRAACDDAADGEEVRLDSASLKYGWGLHLPPSVSRSAHSNPKGTNKMSDAVMLAANVLGHRKVRYETVDVTSTKASKAGKALRELVMNALAEAFAQPLPEADELAKATAAYREQLKEQGAADRERREAAKKAAEKQKASEKKQIAKKIAKEVGKVTDIATFLKALELRADKQKIDKATKMLKASGFQLFNDVTDTHMNGVVKSQTDPDLVYACRIESDGQYACCTQNLNICGGLRGSICKHLLVLIIGLVKAGELDPATIDTWVAKSNDTKPELNKETMGDIFIRYKGAEAGEVDWRPTETVPEDYYAL